MQYSQCFICRQWSWDASKAFDGVRLCLPCYVDVLEVRQARGELWSAAPATDQLREGPDEREPPSPFVQTEICSTEPSPVRNRATARYNGGRPPATS